MQRLSQWLKSLLTLFNPFRCVLCGSRSQAQFDLCKSCEANLCWMDNITHCLHCAIDLKMTESTICGACLKARPRFDLVLAAVAYDMQMRFLLQQLKFYHQLTHSKVAGQLLVKMIERRCADHAMPLPSLIIPVPLHWRRQMQRGFNQSLEISRYVSKALGIPVDAGVVVRNKTTPMQSGLTGKKRLSNVRHAFGVKRAHLPEHVVIVDDIITTGATVNAMAGVLRGVGVEQIEVWCVARTLLGWCKK